MKPQKPLGIKNYGSIPHLPGSKLGEHDSYIHEGQARIITEKFRDRHDVLYVTEKYDGTNVGIAKKNGKIIALQRKGYDCESSPYLPHRIFYRHVQNNYDVFDSVLAEGERIAGEWMYEASGIHYEIKGFPFVAFDYFNAKNERFPFQKMVETFGMYVKTARIIHVGEPASIEQLLPILNNGMTKTLDGQGPEGMVFRIERKGAFDFMAKWVRPDFEPGKYLPGVGLDKSANGVRNKLT